MTVQLITFDLDETLFAATSVLLKAEAATTEWLGERVTTFPETYAANRKKIRAHILSNQPDIAHDLNHVRLVLLEKMLTKCGVSDDRAHHLARSALCIFHGHRNLLKPLPGAIELMVKLKEANFLLISISNGSSEVRHSKVGKYLDTCIYAAHVGVRKPDPAIFFLALNDAACSPDQAIHVGDHPIEDIQAAADVGMHTVQIKTELHEVSEVANRVVANLNEAERAIMDLAATH